VSQLAADKESSHESRIRLRPAKLPNGKASLGNTGGARGTQTAAWVCFEIRMRRAQGA